ADASLALRRVHAHRRRELRRDGARRRDGAGVGDLLAAGAARRAPAHRDLPVRAAVRREAARREGGGVSPMARAPRKPAKPRLLSGGNPQIAMGEGDAPVQAYLDAMPDWRRAVGRKLDALITRTVPGVKKAVKWNSPFYGVEGQGWFLDFHT